MKKTGILLLCFGLVVVFTNSCKKDVAVPIQLENSTQDPVPGVTIAGSSDKGATYFDYLPDTIIGDYYAYTANYLMDLDGDNTNDLEFKSACNHGGTGHVYSAGLAILDTSVSIAMTADSIYPFRFSSGDTIRNGFNWYFKPINQSYSLAITFSYDYVYYPSSINVSYPGWNNNTGYIGVRKRKADGSFIYGWINAEVAWVYQLKIKERYFGGT
ncbi:MAG: hypothetical protein IAF38_03790 [Bacteroidia bacterium]|nr:hypothetical protein [Bacteroidia bacterium]